MTESGYYPPGAEFDSNAPYNQVDLSYREIEVTVSITLSKTCKIAVNDYEVEGNYDEEGYYEDIDYSNCDLKRAVEEQICLPQNVFKVVPQKDSNIIEDLSNWSVDDFEVILE